MEVLDHSGYHSKYYISDDEYEEMLAFYHERGFKLTDNIKDIIRVFGNREIRYNNNYSKARKSNYEVSFSLRSIWGNFKQFSFELMEARIERHESTYSLKGLVPIAIMPSGPMTYFIDNNENIYAFIDDLIVTYKGNATWTSIEKWFNGDRV